MQKNALQTLLNLFILGFSLTLIQTNATAQSFSENQSVQGNIYSEINYYLSDTTIGADQVPEYFRANIYGNILYRYKGFSAGVRYEAYQPPLLGFDNRYEGQGIANRYISYTDSLYEITLGNFYEQFGSGIILRAYEDKNLGIDNAFDGFRLLIRPANGLTIKGMIGKQRYFWENGPGTVRGVDAEWNILQTFLAESNTNLTFGASAVSRFQQDNDPLFNLPENVASFSGRTSLYSGNFYASAEYAHKINDPSETNGMIYKNGQAMVLNTSYSAKGIGIILAAKYIDNMDFRSSRTASSNDLTLSYLPATTRQHTYSLPGMYPYATQPNGEVGGYAQVNYLLPRNSKLGGKYGTHVLLSFSIANSIDTSYIGGSGTKGYEAKLWRIGNEKYYHDLSLEINRKVSKDLKLIAGAANQYYNMAVIEGHPGEEPVKAWIVSLDASYRMANSQNIRGEFQHLQTKEDNGNWAMVLIEYTIAPRWSFTLTDQYNYGNSAKELRKHFYSVNVGYNKGAHRLALNYGKQREGVICVGGVCRKVPAAFAAGIVYSTTF